MLDQYIIHILYSCVADAGDRLEDLTSRDGDWFLDELTSISGNVNYMLGMLTNNSAVSIVTQLLN